MKFKHSSLPKTSMQLASCGDLFKYNFSSSVPSTKRQLTLSAHISVFFFCEVLQAFLDIYFLPLTMPVSSFTISASGWVGLMCGS